MTIHYSEADLLETYYTEPGESMPVMMHLAGCSECSARYERLDRKLREAAACETERPETFWMRQRLLIMRRISERRRESFSLTRALRVAAALVLALSLGSFAAYHAFTPTPATPVATAPLRHAPPSAREAEPVTLAHDAWQSEELRDFHSLVEWESWVEPQRGGQL
jgi:anti-sigma factor RsiW